MANEYYDSISFWFNGILNLCLVLLGITGNMALIASFRYKVKKWLALYFYFFTFAIWNTGLLLATALFNCLPGLFESYAWKWPILSAILEYTQFGGYILGNASMAAIIWVVTAITIERYVAVTKPFHSRLTSPRRRAKFVSILLSVAAFFYSLPLFFEFTVGQAVTVSQNSPKETYLRKNRYYILLYRVLCNSIFLYSVPFVIITVLTVKIVCTVSRSGKKRRLMKKCQENTIQKSSHQTHLLLTFIVFKFLACYSLPLILNISELMVEDIWRRRLEFQITVDISNFLVVGDSASNAFLYFSWRKRIRFYGLSLRKSAMINAASIGVLSRRTGNSKSVKTVDEITTSSYVRRNSLVPTRTVSDVTGPLFRHAFSTRTNTSLL